MKYLGHPILNDVKYGGRKLGNLYKNHKLTLDKENDETNADLIKKRNIEEFINSNEIYITNEDNFTFTSCDYDSIDEICLHSLSYKWKEYYFETPDPYWVDQHLPLNN